MVSDSLKNKILIICATRERTNKINDCIDAWRETTAGRSDFLICLDNDDPQLEEYKKILPKDVLVDVGDRVRLIGSVNRAFREHPDYAYYGFIGDDHHFKTKDWDDIFIKEIENMGGHGIVYGDDLLQGANLATAYVVSRSIPEAIGYMAPPQLIHLCMDDYYMDLGRELDLLRYIPEVVIEHMHPAAKKSEFDQRYQEVNSGEMYDHDLGVLQFWRQHQKAEDVKKVREAINA